MHIQGEQTYLHARTYIPLVPHMHMHTYIQWNKQ